MTSIWPVILRNPSVHIYNDEWILMDQMMYSDRKYSLEKALHCVKVYIGFNTLRPRQSGRHFPDAIFKCIFLNENGWISIKISLKFVPKVPISNIPALGQIMAWRRPGDKPLSEPMMVNSLTHICVTRPQWVNTLLLSDVILGYRMSQHSYIGT